MTLNEVTNILHQFNEWQRGHNTVLRPSSIELGKALDTAVEMLEHTRNVEVALREIAWSNDSKWQADRARSVLGESK